MAVGREDFEAGLYGTDLGCVWQFLPSDSALTEREIQAVTGLKTKALNVALTKLQELGRIQKKQLGGAEHYLKVMQAPLQEWYTLDEAASYLRVSRRTVYQLIKDRQLACYRVSEGGHRRFRQRDLDQVMCPEVEGAMYAMNALADPVLADLWDNEKDAEYDRI